MSETNAQEPTMEEILASIRRIISEDDTTPPATAAASAAQAHPDEEPSHGHDDVLELIDRVEPPPPVYAAAPPPPAPSPAPPEPPRAVAPAMFEALDDIDVSTPAPPAPKAAAVATEAEPLVTRQAAERAAGHFDALTQSLAMPAAGRSLEDVVRELLRPLLKDWLETHLAPIVEARVQAEVERISRGRGF